MVEVSKKEYTIIRSLSDLITIILIGIFITIKSICAACVPWRYRPLKKLDGEVALVTGGAGGIGRLVALRLAKLNVKVVLWDVNAKGVEESVKLVQKEGGVVYGYTCDLTNREEIYKVAEKVKQEVGQVTLLINNAGIFTGRLLLDIPDHLIQRTFDVNILAHFWTTKAFLPKMIETNHGHIVTIASMGGHVGVHKMTDYCSSKFAAVGFDESLRVELEKLGATGVKTTVICPYFIQSTGMFDNVISRFLPTLKSTEVADKIVDGIQKERLFVPIPGYARLIFLKWVFPWAVISLLIRNIISNPNPSSPEILQEKQNSESVPKMKSSPKSTVSQRIAATNK